MWYQRVFKSLSSAYFSCKKDHLMSKRLFKRKYYWFLRKYRWSWRNQYIDSFLRIVLKNGFLFYFGWVWRYLFFTFFMWETNIFAPIWSRPRLFGWCDYEHYYFFLAFFTLKVFLLLRYSLSQQMRELDRLFLPFYQAPWRIPPPVQNQAKTRWVLGGTRKKWYRRIAWVSTRRIEPLEQQKHNEIA